MTEYRNDDECPYCNDKEAAVDEVIEALWKLMREATINFMPSSVKQNKEVLKRALYKMLDHF